MLVHRTKKVLVVRSTSAWNQIRFFDGYCLIKSNMYIKTLSYVLHMYKSHGCFQFLLMYNLKQSTDFPDIEIARVLVIMFWF